MQEPSTSASLPKAIMDSSENQSGKMIKIEDNDDSLFEEFGLNNIASETKGTLATCQNVINTCNILADYLSNSDLDLDPSTFT